jgi:hypothetical protein
MCGVQVKIIGSTDAEVAVFLEEKTGTFPFDKSLDDVSGKVEIYSVCFYFITTIFTTVVCIYVYAYAHTHAYACMHINISTCIDVCVCVCVTSYSLVTSSYAYMYMYRASATYPP